MKAYDLSDRPPHRAINDRIARRLHEQRTAKSACFWRLAELMSIAPQHLHEFEHGLAMIPASCVQMASQLLRVPPAEFFGPRSSITLLGMADPELDRAARALLALPPEHRAGAIRALEEVVTMLFPGHTASE